MAAGYKVSSGTLSDRKSQLEALNTQLSTYKGQYESVAGTLSTEWEGEAKAEFDKTVSENMTMIEEFHSGVKQYIEALQTIIAEYETTEAQNKITAGTR